MERRISSGLGDVVPKTRPYYRGLLSSWILHAMLILERRISSRVGDEVPRNLLAVLLSSYTTLEAMLFMEHRNSSGLGDEVPRLTLVLAGLTSW